MKFPEELRDRAARDRAARDRGEGGRNQGFLGDSNNVPEGVKACQRLSWTSDNRGMGATGCRRSVRMEDTSKGGQPCRKSDSFHVSPGRSRGLIEIRPAYGETSPFARFGMELLQDTPQDAAAVSCRYAAGFNRCRRGPCWNPYLGDQGLPKSDGVGMLFLVFSSMGVL